MTKKQKEALRNAQAIGIITDGKRVIEILKYPTFETDFIGCVMNKPAITLRAKGKVFESPLRENDRFYCNGKYYDLDMVKGVEA